MVKAKFKRFLQRSSLLVIIAVLTLSLIPLPAKAVNEIDEKDTAKLALSFSYYNLVAGCSVAVGKFHGSRDKVAGGDLFNLGWTGAGINQFLYPRDNDALSSVIYAGNLGGIDYKRIVNCAGDNTLSKKALSFWGINPLDMACSDEFKDIYKPRSAPCREGDSDFNVSGSGAEWAAAFGKYVERVMGRSTTSPSTSTKHHLYLNAFIRGCTTGQQYTGSESGSSIVTVLDLGAAYRFVMSSQGIGDLGEFVTCTQLLEATNRLAVIVGGLACSDRGYSSLPSFSDVFRSLIDRQPTTPGLACVAGFFFGEDYCESLKTEESTSGIYTDCIEGKSGADDIGGTAFDPPPITPGSSCAVEGGWGWIICPAITTMSNLADAMFRFLDDKFLQVDTAILQTEGTNTQTYDAWTAMRNIANVAFVIAFIFIIFSQLTGAGISNYGVKKMLPRLVIATILVNVSFFITQIAVDLSNILGYGLKSLLGGIVGSPPFGGFQGSGGMGVFESILSGVGGLGLLALTGVLLWTSLGALIPVLIGALIALLIVFIILILREMLIILLIVISPLAFVAFLLPNTKPLFDRWRKMFTALLLLFPIVGLVYGASTMAANILQNTYSSDGTSMDQIVAAAVMTIPLFVVPIILKKSLDGIGGLGATFNKLSGRLGGAAGKAVMEKTSLGTALKIRDGIRGRNRSIRQSRGRLARVLPGETGKRLRAFGDKEMAKQEAEELSSSVSALERIMSTDPAAVKDPDEFLSARMRDGRLSAAERQAAVHYAAKLGRDDVIRRALAPSYTHTDPVTNAKTVVTNSEELQAAARQAVGANVSSLLSKAPDVVKGATAAFGSVTGAQLSQFNGTTARAYIEHLSAMPAGADRDRAIEAFNAAVDDIRNSSDLQATFDGATGRAIGQALAGSNPALGAALSGAAYIQADGKIR